jgi:quercetin dioxygenase-like cupin family protein
LTWLASDNILGTEDITVGRVIIKKGMSNSEHRHPNCEEVLYLLSGKLEHYIGDEKIIVESGDSILIESGAKHKAVSIGDSDADMIVTYSSSKRQVIGE